jgi:hypothetical protein
MTVLNSSVYIQMPTTTGIRSLKKIKLLVITLKHSYNLETCFYTYHLFPVAIQLFTKFALQYGTSLML